MAFTVTEQVVVDVHVLATRHLNVCRTTVLVDPDGAEVSRRPWRRSYAPGDDISSEPAWVQAVAAAAWTPEAIADYQTWQAQREAVT